MDEILLVAKDLAYLAILTEWGQRINISSLANVGIGVSIIILICRKIVLCAITIIAICNSSYVMYV